MSQSSVEQSQESQFPVIRSGKPKPKKQEISLESAVSIFVWAIFIGLCGGCYMVIFREREPDLNYGTAQSRDTIYDARIYAREAVRIHLKWPDDAEFPDVEQVYQIKSKRPTFRVVGKVRAMNGFGAKLTHKYSADVSVRDLSGREWGYDRVQIGDEILYGK